jgi:phosphate transport system substrate-binding protein
MMKNFKAAAFAAISVLALTACGGSGGGGAQGSRDFVRGVGSSTVYPFATAVAEKVAAQAGIKSPIIESTGTGAGMKLFCAGVGGSFPDVANASRRMKAGEFADCQKNGVTEIIEVQIGVDGLAFAQGLSGPKMNLTLVDAYKALAKQPFGKPQTAKNWSDVNPSLPAIPIQVYGPPTTSGTRDSLAELIMAAGCKTDPAMAALEKSDKDKFTEVCTQVREDGPFIPSGENDNLIVQKLAQNPRAVGAFGYSFLEENSDKLRGIPINGVEPTYETITSKEYPGARAMFIYVKKAHLDVIKGLREFVAEWANGWGPDGYLKAKGMVVSSEADRAKYADVIANMTVMNGAELK